eukprot:UC4_evm3s51
MSLRLEQAARWTPEVARSIIQDGKIIVFRDVQPIKHLVRWTRCIVGDLLDSETTTTHLTRAKPRPRAGDPSSLTTPSAASSDTNKDFQAISWHSDLGIRLQKALDNANISADEICKIYERSPEAKKCVIDAFKSIGVDIKTTQWDRVRLRVQSSGQGLDDVESPSYGYGRFSHTLPIHRDTWASNIGWQINWWAPILPVVKDRTLLLYPSWFKRAVPNSSSTWDFLELKRKRKLGKAYPQMPVYLPMNFEEEDRKCLDADACPLIDLQPGDLVAFSGAHLHASALNNSGVTRLSTEVRTHDPSHSELARGLLAIDSKAIRFEEPLGWFKPIK